MKSIISKTVTLVAIAATLFSFTNYGSEGFEIFLNNKVVIQQFGDKLNDVSSLKLDQRVSNGQVSVKYYHCGRIGRNRIISIRDAQNKLLKEWRFSDATSSVTSPVAMSCNVKDILSLNKGNESIFKLCYSSSELPDGRLLTNIVVANNSVASNK